VLQHGSEVGGYRIERELGRGGMGVVYEATQMRLDRRVALKVLSPEIAADPEFRERFRREGLTQAAIDHPHIITVYEANEADGCSYIAMRLVHGPTLKELIRSGELTHERALVLLQQVAGALDAAHAAGLVHRDVKPPNILVGSGDHAYLADFGITKAVAEIGLTVTGQFLGTPHYIAPEQVNGERVSSASDIYALAAVAFECFTGKVPFQRDTNQAVLFAHVFDAPPRATEVRPQLPAQLDEALARGMAKDPADRPATAGDFLTEVEAALRGEVVAAEKPVASAASPPPAASPTEPPAAPPSEPRVAPAEPPSAQSPGKRSGRSWVGLAVGAAIALVVLLVVAAVVGLSGGGAESGDVESGGAAATRVSTDPDTVTLGSRLDNPDRTKGTCFGEPRPTAPCTLASTALVDRPVAAPSDGAVKRWRVVGAKGRMKLVVLRGQVGANGKSRMTRVASSEEVVVPDGKLHQFSTDLKVKKGDRVGLQLFFGAHIAGPYVGDGARIERWDPPLTEKPQTSDEPQDGYEILYNADLERD
jgi:hypothetical protein